jgi:hypothetical protein
VHDTSNYSNNCLQRDYFTITIPVGQKLPYTKLTVPLSSLENYVMALEASDRLIDII